MKKIAMLTLVLLLMGMCTGCFEGVISSELNITNNEGAGTKIIYIKLYKNGALKPDNSGEVVEDMDLFLPGGAEAVRQKLDETKKLDDAIISLDLAQASEGNFDLLTIQYSFDNIKEYNEKSRIFSGDDTIEDAKIIFQENELIFSEPTGNFSKSVQWILDEIYGEDGEVEGVFSASRGGTQDPIKKEEMAKLIEVKVDLLSEIRSIYSPHNRKGQTITVIKKFGDVDDDKTPPKCGFDSGYDNLVPPFESEITPLKCEPAHEWTELFKTTSGWLGSDGIYSIPMDGKDQIGSGTASTKTFITFADTNIGSVDPMNFHFSLNWRGVNNTAAILTGTEPKPENIQFIYAKDGVVPKNLYEGRVWPADGLIINKNLYLLAQEVNEGMEPQAIQMIRVPVVNNIPEFGNKEVKLRADLADLKDGEEVTFGAGIFDNSTIAGAPEPDEYVYVYGYRNIVKQAMKKLVVARVPREKFEDEVEWEFYDGNDWVKDIGSINNDQACLADHVSPELSVTYINSGIYEGKYMLVYQKDTISDKLVYRIGDSPIGPFGEEVHFYTAPEPKIYGSSYSTDETVIVYNAKAHPHLSKQGELLISYNVNLWGGIPFSAEIYRPRFVILKLDELAKEKPKSTAKNNVALGKPATASHGNEDAHKAVDGKCQDIKADKWSGASLGNQWIKIDLEKEYIISRWVVKHAGIAGELTSYNTQDFRLQRSDDGQSWEDVDAVSYNTASITDRTVKPFTSRYVRLYITKPSQGIDPVSKIYEFEVYGEEFTGPIDPKEPADPAEPADPQEPNDSEEPIDPKEPTQPEKPVDPIESEEPEKPKKPIDPVEPKEPTNPQNPINDIKDKGANPKTGDRGIGIYIILIVLCVVVLAYLLLRKKSKKQLDNKNRKY